jgi:hypothetical protein
MPLFLDIYFIYTVCRYSMEVDKEKIYTDNISVRACLWFCRLDEEKENVPFSLTLDILRYFIWQCKLNKRLPIYSCIIDDVSYTINVIRKTNMEISDLFEHCTLFICRNEPDGDRGRDAADRHGRG